MQHVARIGATINVGVILLLFPAPGRAQEFNCTVTMNIQQLAGSDFSYLQQLEQRVEEYMNEHSFTEDQFQDVERLDCTMQITLDNAVSLTSFTGRIVVAMRRPIYGTSQYTTVVQFNDPELAFNYTQGAPLMHDTERYDPLASVLDFYAYLLLGYDYDTFSEFGGTPYFETARRIAERAQALGAQGWTAVGTDPGRYNLISQILDPRFRPLRQAYFSYHYGGLDHFVQETDMARGRVMNALEALRDLQDVVNRAYAIDMFFAAKYSELTAIFMDSNVEGEAYALLSGLDPSHLTEYNKLTQ